MRVFEVNGTKIRSENIETCVLVILNGEVIAANIQRTHSAA